MVTDAEKESEAETEAALREFFARLLEVHAPDLPIAEWDPGYPSAAAVAPLDGSDAITDETELVSWRPVRAPDDPKTDDPALTRLLGGPLHPSFVELLRWRFSTLHASLGGEHLELHAVWSDADVGETLFQLTDHLENSGDERTLALGWFGDGDGSDYLSIDNATGHVVRSGAEREPEFIAATFAELLRRLEPKRVEW